METVRARENKLEIIKQEPLILDRNKIFAIPGVIAEIFGDHHQMEILTPHAQIFLEHFEEIRKLQPYQKLVQQNGDFRSPWTEEDKAISILRSIGAEAIKRNKTKPKSNFIDDFAKYVGDQLSETMGLRKHYQSGDIRISQAQIDLDEHSQEFARNFVDLVYPDDQTLQDKTTYFQNSEFTEVVTQSAQRRNEQEKTTKFIGNNEISADRHRELRRKIVWGEKTATEAALSVSKEVGEYTRELEADQSKTESMFERARKLQDYTEKAVKDRFGDVRQKEKPDDFPEVIFLGGVGHMEATWRERIEAYQKNGVKARYLEPPDFNAGETYEKQADWIFDQLKNGEGKKFAFEAHSRGGLTLWWLAYKHPEIVSHMIDTSSPARADRNFFPWPIVNGMKWALRNPEKAGKIMTESRLKKAFGFFTKLKSWEEAFRIYLGHIGKKGESQWKIIKKIPWTIPKFVHMGKYDWIVKFVGDGATQEITGGTYVENPKGNHNIIGDHDLALGIHFSLFEEGRARQKAILI